MVGRIAQQRTLRCIYTGPYNNQARWPFPLVGRLMERNLDRRVEVLCPVRDRAIAAHIRDAILRSLESFRGGAPQEDDVTVVVVKVS